MTMNAELLGGDKVVKNLESLRKTFILKAKDIVAAYSVLLASYVKQEKMTGGNPLHARSGELRANTRARKTLVSGDGNVVEGGVDFGTVYAGTHIGPRGQQTVITPKKGQYLTIPLAAAKTAAGVARGGARDEALWGKTVILPTKKSGGSQAIIYGVRKTTKGDYRGGLVPLFLLVKSVTIKASIHPEDLIEYIRPKMEQAFVDEFNKGAL